MKQRSARLAQTVYSIRFDAAAPRRWLAFTTSVSVIRFIRQFAHYPEGPILGASPKLMLSGLLKSSSLPILVTLGLVSFTVPGAGSRQSPIQVSTQSTSHAPGYLPPGQTDASILAAILRSFGEPSLLESAKDASVFSFRVSYFSPVPVREIAVRLVVNSDGTGRIMNTVSSDTSSGVRRTENRASKVEVDKLLQLIEKVGFWSTNSIERAE